MKTVVFRILQQKSSPKWKITCPPTKIHPAKSSAVPVWGCPTTHGIGLCTGNDTSLALVSHLLSVCKLLSITFQVSKKMCFSFFQKKWCGCWWSSIRKGWSANYSEDFLGFVRPSSPHYRSAIVPQSKASVGRYTTTWWSVATCWLLQITYPPVN